MRRSILILLVAATSCESGLTPSDTQQISIPGATFTMGSPTPCTDAQGTACAGDRVPHSVKLSDFALDKTEVTRLQFEACLIAGACNRANAEAAPFDSNHANDPVLIDDPAEARNYCAWKGMLRLPTEAEFEYAARTSASGPSDYPWGSDKPSTKSVPFLGSTAAAGPVPVGTNNDDVDSFGVHDLAGSVPEWVDDAYVAAAGCADRLSYGDQCWGRAATCATERCMADGAACVKGCLPPSDELTSSASGGMVTSDPICPSVAMGTAPISNPAIRDALSSYAVVRGGGSLDRACDLAGYTRRHVSPHQFFAGFRCAKSAVAANAPTPPLSYRFALDNCPTPSFKVHVAVTPMTVAYDADIFPADPSIMASTVTASGGAIDVPCASTVVLRPAMASSLTLSFSDSASCVSGTQSVDLTAGGDVPAVGTDVIALMGGEACATGTCTDGKKNGKETDIDCGGGTCPACTTGQSCVDGTIDCKSGMCFAGKCTQFSCKDGALNGDETDVDCGGDMCGGCAIGKICKIGNDCASKVCTTGKCSAASCMDGVKNGDESDIDCGGTLCAACSAGKACGVAHDCLTKICSNGMCASASCADGVKNGIETDIDCGGTCMACLVGKMCKVDGDCLSQACMNAQCAPVGSCSNGMKDGSETDVDCGGGNCLPCADNKMCLINTDCTSNGCQTGSCVPGGLTCGDGKKDGSETDVDCGGGTCPSCANGKKCQASSDCMSNMCAGTQCLDPNKTIQVGPGGAATFVPSTMMVKTGDLVTWVFASSGHTVTSGMGTADNQFCSPANMSCGAGNTSGAGTIYSHVFSAVGSFPYFSAPAADVTAGMKGTVVVSGP